MVDSGVKHLEALAEAGLPTPSVNQIEVGLSRLFFYPGTPLFHVTIS
jgi:hypothetical protein